MIEKAIETEEKYLQRRLMGEDVVLDLSEYGYKNLDEYFADKRDYQLKHCNISNRFVFLDKSSFYYFYGLILFRFLGII